MNLKKCSRCELDACRFVGTSKWCDLHYRVHQMRCRAKASRKVVPDAAEIEKIIASLGPEMQCPHCKRSMCLHSDRMNKASVASLQHWDSGKISVICFSCNSRHRDLGDDLFFQCGNERKKCSDCRVIKNLDEFGAGQCYGKKTSLCKKCCAMRRRGYKTTTFSASQTWRLKSSLSFSELPA